MNIPQGYKQTELGIIPEDWEVATIKHIADITTGNKNTQDAEEGGKYPFYVRSQNVERINSYSYDCEGVVTAGDGVGTGKIFHYVRGKFGLHQRAYLIYNFKDFDSQYFYWYFSQYFYDRINQMTAKSSVDSVRKEMIEDMCILRAPIAEQRAIEEALSDVDGLIAALDKKIAKKRLLKQGAMQQLLTGKKLLPGFTDEWVEKPIRALCKLYGRIGFRGYTKADLVNKGEGAITFSPSDIEEQKITYSNCDYISWNKYFESPEIQVFNGDIIFCKTASIGKCAIVKNLPECATINPQFVVLKDFKCNNEWLYYQLIDRRFQFLVNGITGGSTIPTMSQEKLYEQVLLCPPTIQEQQAIATILSDMDKEIADLEAQRDKYRLLKSGMMQKLLTGQIRLKTE